MSKVHHVPPGGRKASCGRFPGGSPKTTRWHGVTCELCKAQKPAAAKRSAKPRSLISRHF